VAVVIFFSTRIAGREFLAVLVVFDENAIVGGAALPAENERKEGFGGVAGL